MPLSLLLPLSILVITSLLSLVPTSGTAMSIHGELGNCRRCHELQQEQCCDCVSFFHAGHTDGVSCHDYAVVYHWPLPLFRSWLCRKGKRWLRRIHIPMTPLPRQKMLCVFSVRMPDVVTPGAARLCDEEINFLLGLQSNVFLAAAQCADEIAAYWARTQTTRIGPLSVEHSQAVSFLPSAVAEKLRYTASRWCNASPVFYPLNQTKYELSNCGNGGPQIQFGIGMDDFPGYNIYWPPADLPPLYSYP